MSTYAVDIRNADKLAASLMRYPEISKEWITKAIHASIAELHKFDTRENVPYRTGRLMQSFAEGIEFGPLWGKIGPTVNYALKVHQRSSKPNYMPRIMRLAQPGIDRHFAEAALKITEALVQT